MSERIKSVSVAPFYSAKIKVPAPLIHSLQELSGLLLATQSTTGDWWHLKWGGQARDDGWSGISGMVSHASNTWFVRSLCTASLWLAI